MPKTAKKGFTYFRFETDHFYDPKVKRLKNKFGMEGWGVFHFIVNEIYRVEGCYMVMDADGLFDISDYSRMDEKKVSDIIDYCAELGLFNKELWQDKQILTSEEIQELYVGICKAIHRKPGIPENRKLHHRLHQYYLPCNNLIYHWNIHKSIGVHHPHSYIAKSSHHNVQMPSCLHTLCLQRELKITPAKVQILFF